MSRAHFKGNYSQPGCPFILTTLEYFNQMNVIGNFATAVHLLPPE